MTVCKQKIILMLNSVVWNQVKLCAKNCVQKTVCKKLCAKNCVQKKKTVSKKKKTNTEYRLI